MGLTLQIAAIVAVVNFVATLVVLRVSVFTTSQRLLQIALIWFLPIVGAVVCGAFAWSQALGPTSHGTIDPLYIPADGGGPDGHGTGDCGGGDVGCDGGGD